MQVTEELPIYKHLVTYLEGNKYMFMCTIVKSPIRVVHVTLFSAFVKVFS